MEPEAGGLAALSAQQRRILAVVEASVQERGYPPTIREIAARVGLRSASSVVHHLRVLERAGLLRRAARSPRAVELRGEAAAGQLDLSPPRRAEDKTDDPTAEGTGHWPGSGDVTPLMAGGVTAQVPLVGTVAAGLPLLAEEQVDEMLTLPASMVGPGTLFALRVRGDSMVDAGIHEGDVVVLRRQPSADDGDIVAALLGDEATIKVLRHRGGHAELVPRNAAYPVLPADDATILGKAVCVLRSLP